MTQWMDRFAGSWSCHALCSVTNNAQALAEMVSLRNGQAEADEVGVRLGEGEGREFQITLSESELGYVTWRQKVCI